MVLGDWSVFWPPLAVPPLSLAWKVKEARAAPLLLAGGVHTRLARLAAVITWPAVTGVPESVSVPVAGSVVMVTACRVLAGVSLASLKPKLAALKL